MRKKILILMMIFSLAIACDNREIYDGKPENIRTRSLRLDERIKLSFVEYDGEVELGKEFRVAVEFNQEHYISHWSIDMVEKGGNFDSSDAISLICIGGYDGGVLENVEFRGYAIKPGEWDLCANVSYGGDENEQVYSSRLTLNVIYPTLKEALEESTVWAKMEKAWKETLEAEENGNRCEKGFAIYIHATEGEEGKFETDDITDGPVDNKCDVGERNTITVPCNDNIYSNGGRYYIGIFHTHPPITSCPGNKRRMVGYSEEDVQEADGLGIPGVVFDYVGDGGEICGGHSRYDSYQKYDYGTNKRRVIL